jgi:hypothetical protein
MSNLLKAHGKMAEYPGGHGGAGTLPMKNRGE